MQVNQRVQDAQGNLGTVHAIVNEYEGVRVRWAEVKWDADGGTVVTVPRDLLVPVGGGQKAYTYPSR